MVSKYSRSIAVAFILLVLTACGNHRAAKASEFSSDRTYLDLQPEWRIRVVTPLLKSGGYKVPIEEKRQPDGTTKLIAGDDFIGYETDYYTAHKNQKGVKINFDFADVRNNNGTQTKAQQPIVPLFVFPENIKFVRLLFLSRITTNDHNQAILAAATSQELNSLTQIVQADPESCGKQSSGLCNWVPLGIAVRFDRKGFDGDFPTAQSH